MNAALIETSLVRLWQKERWAGKIPLPNSKDKESMLSVKIPNVITRQVQAEQLGCAYCWMSDSLLMH